MFVRVFVHQDLRRLPCESSSDFPLYPTPAQSRNGGRKTNEDRERESEDQTQQQLASENLYKQRVGKTAARTRQALTNRQLMVDVFVQTHLFAAGEIDERHLAVQLA